jgi:hypothetical protein
MDSSMTRKEFVRRFILMEIADDYENVEHIRFMITRDCSRCGLIISETEIIFGLSEVIMAGLAKAYRLSGTVPALAIQGVPSQQEFTDPYTHFWATEAGRGLVTADRDWWPFDDVGNLRADWVSPKD